MIESKNQILILIIFIISFYYSYSGSLHISAPSPISPDWTIRSPAQDEFQGTPQVGQGISINSGKLWLHQQQLYASDVMVRGNLPDEGTFSGTVAKTSGLLAIGFIGSSSEYVFLNPKKLYKDSLAEEGLDIYNRTFQFQLTKEGVFLEPQHIQLTDMEVQSIELMTASQQASLDSLSFQKPDGSFLFQEDYSAQSSISSLLVLICSFAGGLLGWCMSRSYTSISTFVTRCSIGLSPLLLALWIPRHVWIDLSIRLYLIETPPWMLARIALISAYALSLAYFAMHGKLWNIPKSTAPSREHYLWGTAIVYSVAMHHSLSTGHLLYAAVFLCSPLLLKKLFLRKNILLFESIVLMIGSTLQPSVTLLGILLFRWIIFLSNLRPLFEAEKNRGAEYAFLLLLFVPLQLEHTIRSSYINDVWSSKTLQSQEKNLIGLPLTWSETCEGRSENTDIRVVVSGGSSTGGIYQFKEEPTSFFTSHLHNRMCQNNKDFRTLTTFNYGVEDYNTQLIADQGTWLKEKHAPDILVLYVGVNDILTKKNTKSIRERRKSTYNPFLKKLLFRSKVITGFSLLMQPSQQQSQELVEEVPVADARDNILSLFKEASPSLLVLIPEMAVSPLQPDLEAYDQMLQELAQEHPNIEYYQPLQEREDSDEHLADRNHLTRDGNRWLGEQIANFIQHNEPIID